MTDFIRLDLFPATVIEHQTGDEIPVTYDKCRVFVTNDEVRIYQDAYGGPQIVIDGPLFDFSGDNKVGWTAQIDGGPLLSISRSRGCGCGSMLRGINPFPGVPYAY